MQNDLEKERHNRTNGRVRHKGASTTQNAARERARDRAEAAGEGALEIVPYGRSVEEHERIAHIKQQGRNGAKGCLFMAVLFALFAVYVAGWMSGKYG